jgi:protein-export membrane protein SecD
MSKKNFKIISIAVVLLALLTAVFIEPRYFNQGVDFINGKFNLSLPHFWERPFQLGLDLEGGAELLYEADLSQIDPENYGQAMEGLRDVIERRINVLGVREPEIETTQVGSHYRLKVRIPGITDPQKAIDEIGRTPYLEFQEPKLNFEEIQVQNKKVLETGEGDLESPFQATDLTGRFLEKAMVSFDPNTYESLVTIEFNEEGAKIFENLTEKNTGKPLAILIDNEIISAPRVSNKISGGHAQITGKFTPDEAKYLARNLNAGALPVPIGEPISQITIGPTLGMISLQKSLKAGVIGFLAIIVFLLIVYKFPGFLASIALLIYAILLIGIFKLIPVTLTLAGIGGFILSLGMAVDANVLIFSRFKEEMRSGKNLSQAIEQGFIRAWPSIRDSNMTTLLIGVILFTVGTSFVQGFATTLSLGILFSMFSAVFVTRSFLIIFSGTRLGKIKKLWI